jgi:uncharacterized protein (TIGR00297 family)
VNLRWLTAGGAVAAVTVGILVFWGTGLTGLALLMLFFVSGSLLTAWNERQPLRNARQVIANGGWAAVGAVVVQWKPEVGWAMLVGSLATAQADTWATEIGARSARPPRLITTRQTVPAGTSGGVTPLGTRAGVAGAVALAGLGALVSLPLRLAALAAAVGVLGMMVDSLLGATLEHRGWLGNDGVNLAATSFGALASVALSQAVGT